MNTVNLQVKARPLTGRIEYYWFENALIGLPRTRFHRIEIPFEPFDSGLDHVHQPESTSLVIEWLVLDIDDPGRLAGVTVSAESVPGVEASIYLGAAHNWFDVSRLSIHQDGFDFLIECVGTVQFEDEGVGVNEYFAVKAKARYVGEV